MIRNFKKKFFEIDNKDKFFFIVFTFFPLSLIIGNLVINSFIFLLSVIFLLNLKENKFYIKNSLIYLLLFFFVSLLINLIFSTNPTNSLPRVIKIFFIILLIIQTLRIFNKYKQHTLGNIFLIWSLIFVIVLIDCLFESIFGFNSFGFSSSMCALNRSTKFVGKKGVSFGQNCTQSDFALTKPENIPDKGPNCPGNSSSNCIDFGKMLKNSFELILSLHTCFFIRLKTCSINGFLSNKIKDLFSPILEDLPPANITPSTSLFN